MLFFTSGRAPRLRRSRRNAGSWLEGAPSVISDSAMRDASAALRHAREDIAEAARQAGVDIADAARHASDDIAGAARQVSADAARQLRANAAAAGADASRQLRSNVASVSADASRQLRANAKAMRATAEAVPDELLPAGREAIRKSVDKIVPGRRKRARRGRFGILAVLACTGLALLGVQMLLMRRSSLPMPRRRGWAQSPDGLGMGGATHAVPVMDPAASQPGGIGRAQPIGTASRTGLAEGQRPPADVPPDATTEPSTFDRDAGIRAATEGMVPPDRPLHGSPPSEVADGA